MDKLLLLNKTIDNMQKLPVEKVQEVNDFVEFLLERIDAQLITEGIQQITSESKSFSFLNDEPEVYTVQDLKVKYK